jgi:hypothetical protein
MYYRYSNSVSVTYLTESDREFSPVSDNMIVGNKNGNRYELLVFHRIFDIGTIRYETTDTKVKFKDGRLRIDYLDRFAVNESEAKESISMLLTLNKKPTIIEVYKNDVRQDIELEMNN